MPARRITPIVGPVMRSLNAICAWWKVARWAIGALATT